MERMETMPFTAGGSISINLFKQYFDQRRLGKLYFPNGVSCGNSWGRERFFIQLTDLYKMISGWTVMDVLVPFADIIAVIAFGSAVRSRCVKEVSHSRRKYIFFGKKSTVTKLVEIKPNDADFLVITSQNITRDEVLNPVSVDDYDEGTCWLKGGIHIVNRGVGQLLKGVKGSDTVSQSALLEGVLIFSDERFKDIYLQAGITPGTSRKIFWNENNSDLLNGVIQ